MLYWQIEISVDGDEAGGRRTERGPFWWKVPAHSAGGTTPEPPGRTGTGPPVTAVTSDGALCAVSRVEPWSRFLHFTPDDQQG